jgi:hypothetical protein
MIVHLRAWPQASTREVGARHSRSVAALAKGFVLPFALLRVAVRHPRIARTLVRVTVLRLLIVAVLCAVAFHEVRPPARRVEPVNATWSGAPSRRALHIDLKLPMALVRPLDRGFDIGAPAAPSPNARPVSLGFDPPRAPAETGRLSRFSWYVGFVSVLEAMLVFFFRRWDDWVSFQLSVLVGVRPETPEPQAPRITVEPRWALKKLRRRLRGFVVFAAGVPVFMVLRLVPSVGAMLVGAGLTLWGWYWLAVFAAVKTAHAWTDDGVAPPPALIRTLRDRASVRSWLMPVRLYARAWAWVTRGVNAPASVFERNPLPFLGLAAARMILYTPGFYSLARPILPVAAGRLCADHD